eukprot:957691_1
MTTSILEHKPASSNSQSMPSIAYNKVPCTNNDDDLDISDYDYDDLDISDYDSLFEHKFASNNTKSTTDVPYEEDIIRCNCCNWMKSYFKAFAFTLLFIGIYILLLMLSTPETSECVVEFMFLWFTAISLSRIVIHSCFHGWLVWKAKSLQWINKYESLQSMFFYIEHSKSYLQSSVLSVVSLMWLTPLLQIERYQDVAHFKVTDDDYYTFASFMNRAMSCLILLFTALCVPKRYLFAGGSLAIIWKNILKQLMR